MAAQAISPAAAGSDAVVDLAIVIPAYKPQFLAAALESVASQTVGGFRVYVGDDASPHALQAICAAFAKRLPVTFERFEQNLGGTHLVQQWQRCIARTAEPWVWLFSDDDVMEPNCVEAWRRARSIAPHADVFHFDVLRIDADGKPMKLEPSYPDQLSSREFALKRFRQQLMSYAPDYVFRRAALARAGGIPEFPLAWCSDDAAWTLLAWPNGIHAVRGARVHWRFSGSNISARGAEMARQKVFAAAGFLRWMEEFLRAHPARQGEPGDHEITTSARYWFYNQAADQRLRLFPSGDGLRLLWLVGSLKGHGLLKTMLRMLVADWQALWRKD